MKASEATENIQISIKSAIIFAPIIIGLLYAGALMTPSTRSAALWLLKENHPVELLTFIVAMAGGVLGLGLAWRAKKQGEKPFVYSFFTLFSMALIFVGMEEIAWGQQFFGFASPAAVSAINAQGETTLHNIVGLQGRSEIFRLLFGLSGLVGILLYNSPLFEKIGAPIILLPWAIIIVTHAGIDVYNDYFSIGRQFDYYMQRTSELVEMFIAVSGFLYLALSRRRFQLS